MLALVRELGVSVVRYPGGNFISGYRWADGVGPRETRPTRLNLAWHTLETNAFGTDEFVRWARKAGVEPMLALNLGTGTIRDALDLLEYSNVPGGTTLSEARAANGLRAPHDVRMWCLGNEMDGPWQLGHMTATEYARLATETARAMRQVQPDLELVACGSSGPGMPTFGDWERTVLDEAWDLVDFISLHAYYEELDGDRASFLASAIDLERGIRQVIAVVDDVAARRQSAKRVQLSVDEWNVWYLRRQQAQPLPADWPATARISEDSYTVSDAVVVGDLLITLLEHADRVACACLAQLVNTIAPIHAEPGGSAWRQATFYPFSLTAARAVGEILRPIHGRIPTVSTVRYGDVPMVHAVAVSDRETGGLSLFVVNRDPNEAVRLSVDLRAFPGARMTSALQLADSDPYAANTTDDPVRVVPQVLPAMPVGADGSVELVLPAASWSVFGFAAHRPA